MSQYGELIERIKEISISDYAQSCGYTLVSMGTYFSLKEHDSVRISKRKNMFWRNSNGASGSIIDFVMEFESCSFDEAVEKLAERYGIVVKSLLKYVSCKKTFRTERILKDVSELYF